MAETEVLRIPFSCPRCAENGSIRVSHLNRMIRCKKCETVFHLNRRQQVVLGLPEVERPERGKPASYFRPSQAPKWARPFVRWLTPMRFWLLTSLVVALLAASGMWIVHWRRHQDDDLPTELAARVKLFDEAYRSDETKTMNRLADPDSRQFLDNWLKIAKKMTPKPTTDPKVLFENRQDCVACVLLDAHKSAGAGGSRSPNEVLLFWKLADEKTWHFDVARTLREMGRKDLQ